MRRLGLIGGTGLDDWDAAGNRLEMDSRYGKPSADLTEFQIAGLLVVFLPRHGVNHQLPQHALNYRANIDVFRQLNVDGIVAVNAVGGISEDNPPGSLTTPDQSIDYTWGRSHSFSMDATV